MGWGKADGDGNKNKVSMKLSSSEFLLPALSRSI